MYRWRSFVRPVKNPSISANCHQILPSASVRKTGPVTLGIAINLTLVVVFVCVFVALTSRRVRASSNWIATVTPLASIVGSGFLVSVPLIAGHVGVWAVPVMAALTAVAYGLGGVIRYNIRYGESLFDGSAHMASLRSIETLSHLVLIGAYFISVAYYLVLLSTFGLKLFGITAPQITNLISSALVLSICGVGVIKGLAGSERAEKYTVSANLAAIAALIACLVLFSVYLPSGYDWSGGQASQAGIDGETVRFLMGLLIIVQGFETTRFMGELYDPQTRIRAMRRAQLLSSLIYVVFFALMIPLYPYFTSTTDVTGVISTIGKVSPWLPYVVIGGAIASQFSASVADSIGASGLISETTRGRVTSRHAYLLIGAIAVIVIWATDVISIISLASRAFALFYALQSVVAVQVARRRKADGAALWFSVMAAVAFSVALLGIPASG